MRAIVARGRADLPDGPTALEELGEKVGTRDAAIEEEADEVREIAIANAVVGPRTVVVHPQNTSVFYTASAIRRWIGLD